MTFITETSDEGIANEVNNFATKFVDGFVNGVEGLLKYHFNLNKTNGYFAGYYICSNQDLNDKEVTTRKVHKKFSRKQLVSNLQDGNVLLVGFMTENGEQKPNATPHWLSVFGETTKSIEVTPFFHHSLLVLKGVYPLEAVGFSHYPNSHLEMELKVNNLERYIELHWKLVSKGQVILSDVVLKEADQLVFYYIYFVIEDLFCLRTNNRKKKKGKYLSYSECLLHYMDDVHNAQEKAKFIIGYANYLKSCQTTE